MHIIDRVHLFDHVLRGAGRRGIPHTTIRAVMYVRERCIDVGYCCVDGPEVPPWHRKSFRDVGCRWSAQLRQRRSSSQTSVTRKKRSASSTASGAAEAGRCVGGRASSVGGGEDRPPPATIDDGRAVETASTAAAGWRRRALPAVGSVRQLPRVFHVDSVPPNDDGFLQRPRQNVQM